MANLVSEDLFYEILVRLPLKFLLRLTLICKRWRFLITSIDFHIAHASCNPRNSPSFLVNWYFEIYEAGFKIINKDHNNVLINRINYSIVKSCKQIFRLCYSVMEVSNSVKVYPEEAVSVIGSAHGLVCFCHNFTYDLFFIWNPVIKMLKTVTAPSRGSFEKIIYCISGFYYDPLYRDFRIIEIGRYELESELGKVFIRVNVYSCNLDTWREIRDDSLPNSEFYIAGILNGRVYVYFHSKPTVLVAFDIHDEVFKLLPCPEHSIEGTKNSLAQGTK